MNNQIIIDNITLQAIQDKDIDNMLALLTNKTIKKTYMLPDFKNPKEAIDLFHKIKQLSLSNDHFTYGIYLDNNLIGLINDVMIIDQTIELGYFLDPSYHNQGIMTKCLKACIKSLFNIGYTQIRCGYLTENKASEKVMIKCHMQKEDIIETINYQNKDHEVNYYAIDKLSL